MFLFFYGFRNHGFLGLCGLLDQFRHVKEILQKKRRNIRKVFQIKKTNTHTRPNLPMSLKVQFRHVQASIPRTYKKKRKRSVRKVSQIKKLLPALTNDRPISSYPSQHSEILQKKEKEILGSSQIKKKINTKKKELTNSHISRIQNLRVPESRSLSLKKKKVLKIKS